MKNVGHFVFLAKGSNRFGVSAIRFLNLYLCLVSTEKNVEKFFCQSEQNRRESLFFGTITKRPSFLLIMGTTRTVQHANIFRVM